MSIIGKQSRGFIQVTMNSCSDAKGIIDNIYKESKTAVYVMSVLTRLLFNSTHLKLVRREMKSNFQIEMNVSKQRPD